MHHVEHLLSHDLRQDFAAMIQMLTTFPQHGEFQRAKAQLDQMRLPYEVVAADPGCPLVGTAGLVVSAEARGIAFEAVITLCDDARESCPVFPGRAKTIHHGFDDPPRLAADARSEEEALAHYRRVRDEIRAFIEALPEALTQTPRKPIA